AGLGVSILPASFKRVQMSEMRWVPLAEEDAVSEMWLVWPKHHGPDIILIATGSEMEITLQAAEKLTGEGHNVRVVSLPSTDIFDA
ncbi:hypothetical protein MJL22_26090, partial [Salmonella enterica subsp. enterica serovar Montevideo]|nr:hypothetical protein [Salmonella enterica subsp. enterica serovar Montevideo]